MGPLLFDGWPSLWRVALTTPVLYASLVLFVRLSGKRCTARMNNFDWLVTVAMGSLVASGILLRDVTIAEVLVGVGALLLMQLATTRLVRRFAAFRRLVKAEPRLLVEGGRMIPEALSAERVSRGEVLAAVRGAGLSRLENVEAVVLETNADLSVIPRSEASEERPPILDDVVRA